MDHLFQELLMFRLSSLRSEVPSAASKSSRSQKLKKRGFSLHYQVLCLYVCCSLCGHLLRKSFESPAGLKATTGPLRLGHTAQVGRMMAAGMRRELAELLVGKYNGRKRSGDYSFETSIPDLQNVLNKHGYELYNPPKDGHSTLRCFALGLNGGGTDIPDEQVDEIVRELRRKIGRECAQFGPLFLEQGTLTAKLQRELYQQDPTLIEALRPEEKLLRWQQFWEEFTSFERASYADVEFLLSFLTEHLYKAEKLSVVLIPVVARSETEVTVGDFKILGSKTLHDFKTIFIVTLGGSRNCCLVRPLRQRLPTEIPLHDSTGQAAAMRLFPGEGLEHVGDDGTRKRALSGDANEEREKLIRIDELNKAAVANLTVNGKTRKGRTDLTIQQRRELIHDRRTKKMTVAMVARKYNVSDRTVRKICQQEEEVLQRSLHPHSSNSKQVKLQMRFPIVERGMQEFVFAMRRENYPLSIERIQQQALLLAEGIGMTSEGFKASRNWACGLVKRMGLDPKSLGGEEEASAAMTEIKKLRKRLEAYPVENIYYVHETDLFYKLLPKKSYVTLDEDERKSLKGVKQMKPEDRISLVLCTNASGVHKIPVAVFGAASAVKRLGKDRTEVFKEHNVHLLAHNNPYTDSDTMGKWFHTVFVPEARKRAAGSGKVALIINNCGLHSDLQLMIDGADDIDVIFLPPDIPSSLQPLRHGVVSFVKTRYRHFLLVQWGRLFLHRKLLLKASEFMKRGSKGINQGHQPHLLDALEILSKVWAQEVTEADIAKCWVKSDILADEQQRRMAKRYGKQGTSERPLPLPEGTGPDGAPLPLPEAEEEEDDGSSMGVGEKMGRIEEGSMADRENQAIRELAALFGDFKLSRHECRARTETGVMDVDVGECLEAMRALSPAKKEALLREWLHTESNPDVREALLQDQFANILHEAKRAALKAAHKNAVGGGVEGAGAEHMEGGLEEQEEEAVVSEEAEVDAPPEEEDTSLPLPEPEATLDTLRAFKAALLRVGAGQVLQDISKLECQFLVQRDAAARRRKQ